MSGAIFRTDLSWPAIVAHELGLRPGDGFRWYETIRAARAMGHEGTEGGEAGPGIETLVVMFEHLEQCGRARPAFLRDGGAPAAYLEASRSPLYG